MEIIKKLNKRKVNLYNQAQDLRNKYADSEDADMSKEDRENFSKYMTDFDDVEDQIKEHEKFEAIKANRAEYIDKEKQATPNLDPEARKIAGRQAMVYQLVYGNDVRTYPKKAQDFVTANKQLWDDRNTRANTQSVGTDGKGGYLVEDEWWKEVSVALKYMGPMTNRDLVKWISTTTGGILYGNKTDDTSVKGYLVTESTNMGTSGEDVDWTQGQLDAYKYTSGLLKVTGELLQDANIDILDHIRDLCVIRVLRRLNYDFTVGTGSSQPNGCTVAFSSKGDDLGARAITQTQMLDLFHSIDPAYRSMPSCAWQFKDETFNYLRTLDITSANYNQPMWQPSFAADVPSTILGKPYYLNPDIEGIQPTYKPIYFGDWKQYWVREVKPLIFKTDDSVYFATDEKAVALFGRWDGDVLGYASGVKFGRCATT